MFGTFSCQSRSFYWYKPWLTYSERWLSPKYPMQIHNLPIRFHSCRIMICCLPFKTHYNNVFIAIMFSLSSPFRKQNLNRFSFQNFNSHHCEIISDAQHKSNVMFWRYGDQDGVPISIIGTKHAFLGFA
jgi:hypothetical protein